MTSFVPYHFTTPITLKLNYDNFLIWKHQDFATLRGLKLMHFLQSNNAPPWYLHPDDAHFLLVNDTYLQYDKQDQLIVVWLLASLTTLILIKMVRLESSHHI